MSMQFIVKPKNIESEIKYGSIINNYSVTKNLRP